MTDAGAVDELVALERDVLGPAKRWFAVRLYERLGFRTVGGIGSTLALPRS